ncbi:MAG: hypothetical protein M3220_14935 [Chloroflexota bacterium]|nr:hypothetical protein [Chloroflexota bacterium]
MAEMTPATDKELRQAGTVMGGSMMFVAVRCTMQYVILPFVLPIFGLSNTLSVTLSAIIELFALGMIAYNIHRLWDTDWRWRYLGFSTLIVFIIVVFLYMDLRILLNLPVT